MPTRLAATALLAALWFAAPAAAQTPPAPPPIQFQPANVPWPLSWAQARRAARAEAIRAWGARTPKVVSMRRVSFSKVRCRVSWRTAAGGKRTRTVSVKRTSAGGIQASAVEG